MAAADLQMDAHDDVTVSESLSMHMRTYFSIAHIQAAAVFARDAWRVERQLAGEPLNSENSIQDAFVLGAIFCSVAFLEASINELFADAASGIRGSNLQGLGETTISLMRRMWEQGIPRTARYPVLQKYDIALEFAGKPTFGHGRPPYQNASFLVTLRNALTHYEPESILAHTSDPSPVEEPHRFEKLLKGKFAANALAAPSDPFWPKQCLGHGCAAWAVASVVAYADAFYERMGIQPTYNHVRSALGTDSPPTTQ